MNNLIEYISKQLEENCPTVKFKSINKTELFIECETENGFEILIQEGDHEHTMYFGKWHFHFENNKEGTNELLDYLGYAMTKLGRVKSYIRNGVEYKWTFEIKNQDEDKWHPSGTLALMNFKFWQKPKIKYYQNDLIPVNKEK